jgi:hypothetical protein
MTVKAKIAKNLALSRAEAFVDALTEFNSLSAALGRGAQCLDGDNQNLKMEFWAIHSKWATARSNLIEKTAQLNVRTKDRNQ